MNLRWTIVGLILLTLLGLVAVVSVTLQSNLSPHFSDQEKRLAMADMGKVEQAIDERYRQLENTAIVYAHDDAVQALIRTGSTNLNNIGLTPQRLTSLDVNLAVLVSLDGKLLDSLTYDVYQKQVLPLPAVIQQNIQPGDVLVRNADELSAVSGLVKTPGGPLQVVSVPVLNSDGSGPAAGTLILGRYVDGNELLRISNQIELPLTIDPYSSLITNPEFIESAGTLSVKNPIVFHTVSDAEMTGYILMSDIYGEPAYVIQISLSRTVAHSSQLMLNYLLIILAASVLAFGIITILSVDRLVLAPLHKLGNQVSQVGKSGDPSRRVTIKRRDELGKLGNHINQMLDNLQQSQQRRQASEERFGRLVESMDDMVFTLDENMTELNVYGDKARKLGIPESIPLPGNLDVVDQAGKELDDLGVQLSMTSETLRTHLSSLQSALAGQHLAYEWAARTNGQEVDFQSVVSPMTDHKGRRAGIVGVARDISGSKRMENTLRQRVSDLNALNDASRAFLSQLDIHAIYQESCRLVVENFGAHAAWVGMFKEDDMILQPLAANGIELEQVPPLVVKSKISPYQHPVNAGETFSVLVLFSHQEAAFPPAAVRLYQGFTNLMTIALNNAALFTQVRGDQVRLHALSQRLVDIQEDERRQIALELHDEVGQLLTGLKMQLDTASTLPPEDRLAPIERGRQLAEDLIKKVRNLSLDLRPSMLDDLGLLPALLWHFDRYTSLTGIRINFVQNGLEGARFSINLEITAYRVIQEGLTNIARHAGVKEATVRVLYTTNLLTIQIEDRGAGFNAKDALDGQRSRGLLGMRERIAFVGGSLTIDSVPGWGTLLIVELPVSQEEDGGIGYDHSPVSG
jgi:signal transduction histidine kinase/sensor domain CHASE-containing protein